MKAVREYESEVHPFEQFKATMRKLVTVTKEQLNEQLKEHERTKPERRAGRKKARPEK